MEDEDLQVLIEFLSRWQPDVLGRSGLSTPHTEDAARLLRFASGQCSDEERMIVCSQLRLHPAWLRWLADRVKASQRVAKSGSLSREAA